MMKKNSHINKRNSRKFCNVNFEMDISALYQESWQSYSKRKTKEAHSNHWFITVLNFSPVYVSAPYFAPSFAAQKWIAIAFNSTVCDLSPTYYKSSFTKNSSFFFFFFFLQTLIFLVLSVTDFGYKGLFLIWTTFVIFYSNFSYFFKNISSFLLINSDT